MFSALSLTQSPKSGLDRSSQSFRRWSSSKRSSMHDKLGFTRRRLKRQFGNDYHIQGRTPSSSAPQPEPSSSAAVINILDSSDNDGEIGEWVEAFGVELATRILFGPWLMALNLKTSLIRALAQSRKTAIPCCLMMSANKVRKRTGRFGIKCGRLRHRGRRNRGS